MKGRIAWSAIACLMVLSLAFVSCAPAAETEEGEPVGQQPQADEKAATAPVEEEEEEEKEAKAETTTVKLTKLDGTVVEKTLEKPEYGGVFTISLGRDVLGFDDCYTPSWFTYTLPLTNSELLTGDWTRGPIGTNESSWLVAAAFIEPLWMGDVAESWEYPDDTTMVYHIRKGIHFHNKPPVNGRELTADDVVFSYRRLWETDGGYFYTEPENRRTITAPDKWTVVIKAAPGKFSQPDYADLCFIVPHEVVEKYGNLRSWENSCGTGPFMLTDYVPQSSITFKRNPTYWQKDPLRPENSLPYLDGVKMVVIQDASTRLSALRTGKIDVERGIGWEDEMHLATTNPQLEKLRTLSMTSMNIYMRMDNPALPWHDKRVRHALHMAIDLEKIRDDYYGGNAEILTHPVVPLPEFEDWRVPFEELPQSTQDLFRYNPEEAKRLLAEAGFPSGFKTSIVTYSAYADILSVVKKYWADIGVDLGIEVKEYGVWNAIAQRKTYEEMLYCYMSNANLGRMSYFTAGSALNFHMIEDPRCEETYDKLHSGLLPWLEGASIYRQNYPYILDQAWSIELPTSYSYTMWWPWVKDYHGEYVTGWWNVEGYTRYIWIDGDMKKSMGY